MFYRNPSLFSELQFTVDRCKRVHFHFEFQEIERMEVDMQNRIDSHSF